ncbi:hypothetical protein COV24_03145, partial [candidate division WWE3 bacterium CG10_big_fil_rev_8_21_14_0_10_32_10]
LLSFFGFRYFGNPSSNINDKINGDGASDTLVEDSTDYTANSDSDKMDSSSDPIKNTDSDKNISANFSSNSTWSANNYEPNELKGGTHKVEKGDTLWELAEAYYGNGANWHQIASANNVTYLANGNPLIIPGQTLTIPALQ